MAEIEIIFTDASLHTVLMDSISYVTPENRGDIIISGSHGGTSSAGYALDTNVGAAFFNDAGVGKNGAGIRGLLILDAAGIIAAAACHTSAEIANARDTFENGIIAYVNRSAERAGIIPGTRVDDAVEVLRQHLTSSLR